MSPRTALTHGYSRTERVARKPHRCFYCDRCIGTGAPYVEVIASPRYDANPNPGHWTRGRFCLDHGGKA